MGPVAAGLPPGPASVTVTDAWGCTASFDYQVLEPDSLQFSAIVQDASGQQSADGSILVNAVTGGTAPYDYLWSPGSSMAGMLQSLLPGQYLLTVTDDRGCQPTRTFEVGSVSNTKETQQPITLLIYPNPASESTTLSGDFEGRMPAALELYDATGRLVHTWVWPQSGGGPLSLSLKGLSIGTYLMKLKDAKGQLIGSGRLVRQ